MTTKIVPQDQAESNRFVGDGGDGMRALFASAINDFMEQEVVARLGAERYERTGEQRNHRNGTRPRTFDTRMGTLELAVPRIRDDQYQPAFLHSRQRVEDALVGLVHEAYINGVSTRKVQKLAKAMGITSLSKSQVSELIAQLDERVEAFRTRALTDEYPYVMVDAIYEKAMVGTSAISHAVVIAYGVNMAGEREPLGIAIVNTESAQSWGDFFRSLLQRGLRGVRLVMSDGHAGLKKAISEVFLGASWQRCKVHFMRNVLAAAPKKQAEAIAE